MPGVPGRYLAEIPEAWRVMFALRRHHRRPPYAPRSTTWGATTSTSSERRRPSARRSPVDPSRSRSRSFATAATVPRRWCVAGRWRAAAMPTGRRSTTWWSRWSSDGGASALGFPASRAPEVPDPEACPVRSTVGDSPFARIPYHHQTDFRIAMGNVTWGAPTDPGEPEAASWFRFCRSPMRDGRWEPAVLAVPGDVLGPAVHAGIGGRAGFFFVISLQIGLKFVDEVRTEWVLQHSRAQSASHGFASGTAELYDANRSLVAVATQTALLRPVPDDPGATDA
ncbi:MAG: thioesterase family protein [Microthrixaceae bacterium]